MLETIECSHDVCNCVLTAEIETEEYCSDACREADKGGIEMEACDCGHPPCDAQ